MKAGSVVTATKSLFNAFIDEQHIPSIFRQSSLALKRMNLRGLFMAMTMVKIKDNRMIISIAGMPSALVYRRETENVEEIAIRAMPLGSVANFNYQEKEMLLSKGDCVLLMSDGFPEMFNQSGEMIGFDKAPEILSEIADKSSQEIINHLVAAGESWAGTRPADDDVTFVVFKAT